MKRFFLIISVFIALFATSCEEDNSSVPDEPKNPALNIPFNEEIVDCEDHCDILFGMVFSPDFFQFVEPNIKLSVDGYGESVISLDYGTMGSAVNNIDFESFSANIGHDDLNYWWVGIQRKGLNVAGRVEISFKKKEVDYSKFDKNYRIKFDTFAELHSIPKGSTTVFIDNLNFYNFSIGVDSLDTQIDRLVATTHTKSFGSRD